MGKWTYSDYLSYMFNNANKLIIRGHTVVKRWAMMVGPGSAMLLCLAGTLRNQAEPQATLSWGIRNWPHNIVAVALSSSLGCTHYNDGLMTAFGKRRPPGELNG